MAAAHEGAPGQAEALPDVPGQAEAVPDAAEHDVIMMLKTRKAALKAELKAASNRLRKEQKRRSKLLKKAACLSRDDLLYLMARQAEVPEGHSCLHLFMP